MDPNSTLLNRIGELVTYDPDTRKVNFHHNCCLNIIDGKIVDIGPEIPLESHHYDCNYKLVTPGFIDSHTHPVFLSGREDEFKMRVSGASYQEIASAGGGIASSIKGVRESNKQILIEAVSKRMDRFISLGTTTIEAKSGYGLSLDSELTSLEIIDEVNNNHPLTILPTFMGAHTFPPEYSNNEDGYVDHICNDMIPAVAEQGIARFCDVFCENGYFTIEQSRKILKTAMEFGMRPRLHADEFEDSGAAILAGELKALSADHLMSVSDPGIKALLDGNVIATLLPGTTFFLGMDKWAPARKMLDQGVQVALASDFNPGSSTIQSMPFIISLACIYLKMTPEEAFIGATYNSAKSLGIENTVGTLSAGMDADILVWDVERLIEIPYYVTDLPLKAVFKQGKILS